MPLGSSSAAPVTMPGPSLRKKRKNLEKSELSGADATDRVRVAPRVTGFFAIDWRSYPSISEISNLRRGGRGYARSRKSLRSIAYCPSLSVIDLGDRLSIRREMS